MRYSENMRDTRDEDKKQKNKEQEKEEKSPKATDKDYDYYNLGRNKPMLGGNPWS